MPSIEDLARIVVMHRFRDRDPMTVEVFRAVSTYTATVINDKFGVPTLPLPNETVAVALDMPKTASLFFDRVWSMPHIESAPPPPILVYGATPYEIWMLSLFALAPELPLTLVEQIFPDSPTALLIGSRVAARDIATALQRDRAIPAVPIYGTAEACRDEYKQGRYEVLVAALANLNVPNESMLSWEQVLQFRSDAKARASYRRLVHWADKELLGKSVGFIEDELAIRLEAYEAAMKKHGIQTVIGAFEAMLDPAFLTPAAAIVGALALGGAVSSAEWTAAAIFGGRFACKLARGLLDLNEGRRGASSEVAFIYEITGRGRSASSKAA